MVIGTSTVLAVLLYAGACLTWRARSVEPVGQSAGIAEILRLPIPASESGQELDLAA